VTRCSILQTCRLTTFSASSFGSHLSHNFFVACLAVLFLILLVTHRKGDLVSVFISFFSASLKKGIDVQRKSIQLRGNTQTQEVGWCKHTRGEEFFSEDPCLTTSTIGDVDVERRLLRFHHRHQSCRQNSFGAPDHTRKE
jgi:hypothetical protein